MIIMISFLVSLPAKNLNNHDLVLKEKIEKMEVLPVDIPEWFYQMDDVEKWQFSRNLSAITVDMAAYLKDYMTDNSTIKAALKKNTKFLNAYKPFYPRFGVLVNTKFNIDRALKPDLFVGVDLLIFKLKGRLIISPGLDFKIYNEFGGGLKVGIGFTV